ncbi:MAG: NYN domain-containing protein [Methanomicrobiales archaeon]|nr:NYN domain-containing protein [Methanomicrobiales archaeon]
MPYFLDGNNLIGRARETSRPTPEDRSALISELCERLRRTRARVVVFFDGTAPAGASALGSLSIRFSGGASADEAILREISRSPAPGEVVVVTADRGLSRLARDAGSRTLAPQEFWRRFGGSPGAGAEPARPVDVEEWMRYFEDESNRD